MNKSDTPIKLSLEIGAHHPFKNTLNANSVSVELSYICFFRG